MGEEVKSGDSRRKEGNEEEKGEEEEKGYVVDGLRYRVLSFLPSR